MIIILSHRYPDFDALASMAAAQKLYPDAHIVIEGKYNAYVQEFIALAKEHLPYFRLKDIDPAKVEKIVLVDTNDLSRAVSSSDLLKRFAHCQLEIIDHHPYLGPAGDGISIHEVGACTTILVEKIMRTGVKISSFDATLFALGIYDDTGSLLFESTTSRDAAAVAYLLEQGAQLGVISEHLHKPLNMQQLDLFQCLLDCGSVEKYSETPVYISYAETQEYIDGLALIIHRLGEIEDADIWFIVVKMENRVYVVGRSRAHNLPIHRIVAVFGGSGHEQAASAVIKDKSVEEVLALLKHEVQQQVERPHLIRDIMSFPVKAVHPDMTIEEVVNILLRYGHTGVPVVKDGRLAGIISRRDVDKAMKHGLAHAPVKGFMTKDVVTVRPDLSWEEAQKLMVEHDIGRIPVVEDGKIVGIVSRSDVLHLVYGRVVPTTHELVRQRSLARREDMLALIRELPSELQVILDAIREVALVLDYPVYLVGGFVRDLLLKEPSMDLDVVVEGDGIKFAELLSKRVPAAKTIPHVAFGTARLEMSDGTHVDIAGSRREDYDYPGALPVVEESNLRDDLFRRDFTINAMALSLNEQSYGEVVDYYGGFRDLHQGEIRFLHNLSFIDDPTRILRAARFAGRYGFRFAKITRDAVATALETNVLARISVERFTEELLLIFQEKKYQKIGKCLSDYGILKAWFNQTYDWNFSEPDNEVAAWSLEQRWLVALKNIPDREVVTILSKLKLGKRMAGYTTAYIHLRQELEACTHDMVKVDEILAGYPNLLLEVLSRHDDLEPLIHDYHRLINEIKMSVSGAKILRLGVREGPEVGRILKVIRAAWLRGQIRNQAEEEEYIKMLILERSQSQ